MEPGSHRDWFPCTLGPRPCSSFVPITQATCTAWWARGLLAAQAGGVLDRLLPGLLGIWVHGPCQPPFIFIRTPTSALRSLRCQLSLEDHIGYDEDYIGYAVDGPSGHMPRRQGMCLGLWELGGPPVLRQRPEQVPGLGHLHHWTSSPCQQPHFLTSKGRGESGA